MAEAQAVAFTDNLLTCSICLGEYEDPRVLPCYHTFCYGCISEHATRTTNQDGTFQCPLCREKINFPRDGLVKLKKDFRVHTTKELLSQKRQQEVSSPSKETDVNSVNQVIISCEKHPNNELKYYCEDDDTIICCECIITEHSGHRISSVEQVAKCNRDKIKVALVKTMKTLNRFKNKFTMGTVRESRDSQIRTVTIKDIKDQAQRMRKLIDQREETLISEVNSAYDVRKKQNEANKNILELHHAFIQSTCDFAQKLIDNGTDSDIMAHAKSLTERLAAKEKTPVPTSDILAQISYLPGEISAAGLEAMLGQVTVQSQPPLAERRTPPRNRARAPPLPDFAKLRCMHSFNTGLRGASKNLSMYPTYGLAIDELQVFVVDILHDRIKMYTHLGKLNFDIDIRRPFDLTVSQTDHLYITSKGEKSVLVYTTRGQQVTTMGQGKLEDPRGITLNREGHVMVCDGKKKSILVFHADGRQLLDTIPLSMCRNPTYITVNSVNDNIVISDVDQHCVHVLSPTGAQLCQYGSTEGSGNGQLARPCGVCTDRYGHILIADCNNHRIVALSPRGQLIRYIVTENDGLESPKALTIDHVGRLVVEEAGGNVKTFIYI
ncbi:tripartite motif-containing protein 3-like [Lingula anatina]|uniref:Tripartite motif-containing protein 3-like n=1 Tax=Lingula anatina TaxID=7574 RepID=A0A1S3JC00_LINAN|nr:tripartite motif-containing protein 3-like [Lingula anatina]|eukprot:XP_013407932.1 tripartite motif-containing protein 3-like [Lingula anatina]